MMEGPNRVVALGGGHGLAASLGALRAVTPDLTAIVTVADDGGSSGRLRAELKCLPPGDLRMALSALCDDTDWGRTWRDVLQHRFSTSGPLNQHAVGNLLIASIWELLDDPVAGLDLVARLLGARGTVLPMAMVPLDISARVRIGGGLVEVHGQSRVAVTAGRVEEIWITPEAPPACPQAVEAVMAADAIVLGPGSWYTSVLPHLLVPELRTAIQTSRAARVITMNLVPQRGETSGLSPGDHLRVLHRHAPELRFDVVIADPAAVADPDELAAAADELGARMLLRQVRGNRVGVHDRLRLAAAYRDAFEGAVGDAEQGRCDGCR